MTITSPGDTQSSSYTAVMPLDRNSYVKTAPDGVPYYGTFHIDTTAIPAQMKMQITPFKGYTPSGGTLSGPLSEADNR